MNVFGLVKNEGEESLTEDNYSSKTNRDWPYYRPEISKICPYFAICPECGNPIQIVNIYKDIMIENERLKEKVQNEKWEIYNYIQKITGIYFKFNKITEVIDAYLNRRDYEYKGANERNLPYSILITGPAISIFGYKIMSNEIGNEISNIIASNSKYFEINEGQIKKKENEYVEIKLLVYKHKIMEEDESVCIKIWEGKNKTEHILLREKYDVMDCPI